MDLRWTDTSSNETGFRIERSANGTTFGQIATVGANVTTYSNTNLTAGTRYWYRVRAYNTRGDLATVEHRQHQGPVADREEGIMTRFRSRWWYVLAAAVALLGSATLGLALLARDAPAERRRCSGCASSAPPITTPSPARWRTAKEWWSSDGRAARSPGPASAAPRTPSCGGTTPPAPRAGRASSAPTGADVATAAAVGPDGAVYVAGQFAGTGQPGATPFYAFVRKYDASGKEVWTQQFGAEGASATTTAASVAVDGSGAVYVAGWVFGSLPGQTEGGQDDAFVRKYDAAGKEVWTRQIGGPGHDLASTVAVDAAGNIYVATQSDIGSNDVGTTVVHQFGPDGTEQWTRETGAGDVTIAVTVDRAGAIYLVGELAPAERVHDHAQGNHRGTPFVRKYNPNGTVAWTQRVGAGGDRCHRQGDGGRLRRRLRRGPHERRHRGEGAQVDRLRAHVRIRRLGGRGEEVRGRPLRDHDGGGGGSRRCALRRRVDQRRTARDDRQRPDRRVHRQVPAVVRRPILGPEHEDD